MPFPGERGISRLKALKTGVAVGVYTGIVYAFWQGADYLVDKRDLPGLDREAFGWPDTRRKSEAVPLAVIEQRGNIACVEWFEGDALNCCYVQAGDVVDSHAEIDVLMEGIPCRRWHIGP